MAIPGYQQVTATISPSDVTDVYATHDEQWAKGSYRSVADNTARDAITTERRSEGMLVYVIATGLTWQLASDLLTWNAYTSTGIPATDIMRISVYDPNNDQIVTNSAALSGASLAQVRDITLTTGNLPQNRVTNLVTDLGNKVNTSALGVTVATLVAGTVPVGQLPFSATAYQGAWNVTTNNLGLSDGSGSNGQWAWITVQDTRDLGSGPILWLLGYAAVHNGTIWELGPLVSGVAGIQQIDTDNGSLAGGTVTLDDTSYFAESTDRNYVLDTQKDALAGSPNPATLSNYYTTRLDLANAIVVGNTFLTPELFANGETTGDGTNRTLASLGYDNTTAAAAWPLTASLYPGGLTAAGFSIDAAIWQELEYTKLTTGAPSSITPGNKSYYSNKTIYIARDQTAIASNRRSLSFSINFNGCRMRNSSGGNMILFDRYPTNQADADALISYQYVFMNGVLTGNSGSVEADTIIRLGASSRPLFKNLNLESSGCAVDLQFGLEPNFEDCNISDYGYRGFQLRNGQWTGAALSNAQTNITRMTQIRAYNSSGNTPDAGIYSNGNYNVIINQPTFEGFNGSVHHIYYENTGTTPVNCMVVNDPYFEVAGASRAAMRFRSGKGQFVVNQPYSRVNIGDMPVLIEGDNDFTPQQGRIHIVVNNAAADTLTSKFRAVGNPAYPVNWYVNYVRMINNTTFNTAANFDTGTITNSYIPGSGDFRFTAPL